LIVSCACASPVKHSVASITINRRISDLPDPRTEDVLLVQPCIVDRLYRAPLTTSSAGASMAGLRAIARLTAFVEVAATR
jgi:hypothetical protein